jgi:Transglycosylase SLT domain
MDLIPLILSCAQFVSQDTMSTYIEQRSQANPLAIHITETDRWIRPKSQEEAIAVAKRLVADGMDIEAGLAQIKSADWKQYGLTPETVFDPCKNLGAAERLLVADYRPPKISATPTVQGRKKITGLVHKLAPQYALDPKVVLAVIEAESNFNPKALSPKQAQGLMQLIPQTAQRFGVADPWDPEQNLQGGMAYLRWLLDHFGGDLKLALAGYNAGEQAVERHGGIPPYTETQRYVKRIVKRLGTTGAHPITNKKEGKGRATHDTKQARLLFDLVADGFADGGRLSF